MHDQKNIENWEKLSNKDKIRIKMKKNKTELSPPSLTLTVQIQKCIQDMLEFYPGLERRSLRSQSMMLRGINHFSFFNYHYG